MSNPSDRWRPTWLLAVAVLAIVLAIVVGYCASDAPDAGGKTTVTTAE